MAPAGFAPRQPARGSAPARSAKSYASVRAVGSARGKSLALPLPLPFSPVACALALVITLGVAYIALIATVMSYATHTVGFSQSVRDDEAAIASLESQYLDQVSAVTATDYAAQGYDKPVAELYVPKAPETALR